MTVTIVVAIAENYAIGKSNQLLWHMPADLKHFKQITSGHTVVMGRKTYDSVGKPLPNRRNIIISRQEVTIPGCEVVTSVEDALELCANEDEVFIVGGAEIYKLAINKTDRIYLTIIHHSFDADSFFPEIDYMEWKEVSREDHPADEKHKYAYSFITLERI